MIGKGGAVIRALTEETGTTIDIQDDGTITIASVNADACNVARKRIEDITAEVEVGRIYEGTVLRLLDFGAIVQVLPGKDGLLHISQIAKERVNQVSDYVKEGQIVRVKVLEADDKGRLRLSMKAAAEDAARARARAVGADAGGVVRASAEEGRPRGAFSGVAQSCDRGEAGGLGYARRRLSRSTHLACTALRMARCELDDVKACGTRAGACIILSPPAYRRSVAEYDPRLLANGDRP